MLNSSGLTWVKSSLSHHLSNCVEIAALPDGGVAFRNSRFPDGTMLRFTGGEWEAFRQGAKAGEFDDLCD